MIEQTASVSAGIVSFLQSSGLSSSPVRAQTGAFAPDPVDLPLSTGTAGAVPLPAPATFLPDGAAGPPGAASGGLSCIRTEDGTVILFDRLTGRAVSAVTRVAAEAALRRLVGSLPAASTA
ncbi:MULTISPECIES: hypothetical protein [unclassified Mesorhizobium]|uniref:hypothetical protein n=1 Tax=unclassified Mesorhizobium TaxID=325217 RepID=UPI0003CF9729|nr:MULTISPECIES: hypothetical protein [unclassified Mesorhizobium]ESY54119.1 hypothetical protein X745_15430 [Mesorhizobium sp. LNJC374B00]ESY59259.1 hypothetical protein X744_15140 [Mesorhizobium sp. LNJC372A00]WJI79927.1 hypothetical protein NLY34_24170 [Mesorhizobium sp. C374B]WJI86464.1 hypothetical protein NLY42_26565 [Mesorhizobium sp. C372A]